jgi:hypothetical protein
MRRDEGFSVVTRFLALAFVLREKRWSRGNVYGHHVTKFESSCLRYCNGDRRVDLGSGNYWFGF